MTVPSRQLARSARRNADQAKQALADLPANRFLATITALPGVSPVDGTVTVAVTYRGKESLTNGYLVPYTPQLNDWVICEVISSQVFVLGKVVGTP